MEQVKRRYFVAILLPEHIGLELTKLAQRYGLPPWPGSAGPRITLVTPFDTDLPEQELMNSLSSVRVGSCVIRLDGLGSFDNGDRSVLFIRIKPSHEMAHLANQVLASIGHVSGPRTRPFRPHISLTAPTSKAKIDELAQRLAHESFKERISCTDFHLLRQDNGQWMPIRKFHLLG